MPKPPIRVSVTGAAGQIAYSLLFKIATGEVFGTDQPLELRLLDLPPMVQVLEAVLMELKDCCYPLVSDIQVDCDPFLSFEDIDYALLVGAQPRGPGMERKDLLQENAKIFIEQGKALNSVAKQDAKVFVVGNPCNTNCLIARSYAKTLNPRNFFAMTRLDQNRASYFLAHKAQVATPDVTNVTIWGNHSSTQVPDYWHAKIKGKPVSEVIDDQHWLNDEFPLEVQQRGAMIIQARGKSSAASAASSLTDAIRDLLSPTASGDWFSAGVTAVGNPYKIDENLIFSFPCVSKGNFEYNIVEGLQWNELLEERIRKSEKELLGERDLIKDLLPK